MRFELLLFAAIVCDLIVGDPRWFPHPVRIIGMLCVVLEKFTRRICRSQKAAGFLTVFLVLTIVMSTASLLFFIAGRIHINLQIISAVILLYFLIAIKDLLKHSNKVYQNLEPVEDLYAARIELAKIVGRDTENLSKEGVIKACIETVAENMVDGITAPLFWAVIFSLFAVFWNIDPIVLAALGMLAYKAINTMDSMFGYKNQRYINFGWAPAKLDDIVNYLPSRLSGLCVIAGAFLSGKNWKGCSRIYFRDRYNHTSPNAGHTEAAIAGALDLQLGGNSVYFGEIVKKPTLGDKITTAAPKDIISTHILVAFSSCFFLTIIVVLRYLCI